MSQTILKKAKIIATIGPASSHPDTLTLLAQAGMNVIRVNMSHGDHSTHLKTIKAARAVSKNLQFPLGILQDLSGPKIRIGDFEAGTVELKQGQQLILSGQKCEGTAEKVFFSYPHIKKDMKPGIVLMLDDGKKKLVVEKVVGTDVYTRVLVGGMTKGRRGVNIPGAYLSIASITEKDKQDLAFGLAQNVDFIALSFVRTAQDIIDLKKMIQAQKKNTWVIAKIETPEAVKHIDAIIEVSDGIMVARGDLAIEIGPENVPAVQKMIIKKCNEAGKPVTVATQMLESMIHSPVATRAEVSDVANAIFDGADAIMLSEETALGEFPVEAVTVMARVAAQAEEGIGTHRRLLVHSNDIVDSVSSSVVHNAEDVKAKLIVAFTESGFTPRLIARYKPQQPVIAITPHDHIARCCTLIYGSYPLIIKKFKYLEEVVKQIGPRLIKEKLAAKGDRIVITAGSPFGKTGSTNTMIILTI